jgi:FeS assembly SUF system protein
MDAKEAANFRPDVLRDPPEGEAEEVANLRREIVAALRTVFDPEIPINIYDLGLIYQIDIKENKEVEVQMTLTSPNCPEAGVLPGIVEEKARQVPGVLDSKVDLVWEPMWGMHMMSEAAKLQLNL